MLSDEQRHPVAMPNKDARGSEQIPTQRSNVGNSEKSDWGAAIYARTSSENQQFGYSIEEQVRRCWERCETNDWEIRYVFMDESESGRDTERPEFQRLLAVAEQGTIDVVVFWALDRFCRSLVDLVKIEQRLDQWNVSLQSVTEHLDTTTPVGRFNFRNLASAAELESDLTSQRVQMGMYGLAKDHKWPNNQPPLGYDLLDDGRLQINGNEADLVRQICEMYVQEQSMPRVAFLLNEDNVQTKSGEEWCTQSVRKVVSNELYTGEYNIAGYEEQVEEYRIVSDELFEQVKNTRYRFQSRGMEADRKETKSKRILEQYKQHMGFDE